MKTLSQDDIYKFLSEHNKGYSTKDLAKLLNVSTGAINHSIRILKKRKLISVEKKYVYKTTGVKTPLYRLK